MRRTLCAWLSACALLVVAPAQASGEWVLSPYVGPTFGADIGSLAIAPALGGERKLTYGGSLGYLGPGFLGLEFDIGYSPAFFEGGTILGQLVSSNVTTAMANVLIGGPRAPGAAFGPYVSGGVGVIRTEVGDALNLVRIRHTALGVNGGAGFMLFFSDRVGMRTDMRYFRSLENGERSVLEAITGNLNFLRGSVGLTLRF
jgi:hypothetical protein